jgi:cyclopropane fatty-acyl-phospholipid synthase-like methyltransferase
LRTGKPANWGSYKDEKEWAKAMEAPAFAASFTAAMDCRGRYLAPAVAAAVDCAPYRSLLDIAGGSGVYACAFVEHHSHLHATVLEKPPVDEIARAGISSRGCSAQVRVEVSDMFAQPVPQGHDIHLFSNVLHDWDEPQVLDLLKKTHASIAPGGMVIVHDMHLNRQKTGPYAVAAYSALLMNLSEGRCYSVGEMETYLKQAGFTSPEFRETAADRSIILARKPSN